LFGHIDVLVNKAGCESIHAALDLELQEWDRIVDTNLHGAFICSKAGGAHDGGARQRGCYP
jgi:glucose 1-dehydrogenase